MVPMGGIGALSRDRRRLLELYGQLDETEREGLLAYAEFLAQRQQTRRDEDTPPSEPIAIERPAKESVIAAIRRLSQTYPMLDRTLLLDETSTLMTAHLMHGRAAADVIDELEQVFEALYQRHSSAS